MTTESAFIEMLRAIATDPAARGLSDDAAILPVGSETLVLTHDVMVEGVHWLASSNAADVAWKLVSVNLSDLAAKGANPVGVLLGFSLGDSEWDTGFANGLAAALAYYDVPLLGGDTVKADGPVHLGMTAVGVATHIPVPSRSGARSGDVLYVTGNLGEALAGFELAQNGLSKPEQLSAAYHRPMALLSEGRAIAPQVHAMMDVSDGLLLDATRMAKASGLAVSIDVSAIPLSAAYVDLRGNDITARIEAASWGDDYQLLFAGQADANWPIVATAVGQFSEGEGISLHDAGVAVIVPEKLGYEHR